MPYDVEVCIRNRNIEVGNCPQNVLSIHWVWVFKDPWQFLQWVDLQMQWWTRACKLQDWDLQCEMPHRIQWNICSNHKTDRGYMQTRMHRDATTWTWLKNQTPTRDVGTVDRGNLTACLQKRIFSRLQHTVVVTEIKKVWTVNFVRDGNKKLLKLTN